MRALEVETHPGDQSRMTDFPTPHQRSNAETTRPARHVGSPVFVPVLVLVRAILGYIDPGSGSFIFQMVIGGLLAVAVTVRAFWGRILGVFRREPRKPSQL